MDELLSSVTQVLDELAIPYMITGSIALNFYVLPRATRDIDIVIETLAETADAFIQRFSERFYLEPNTVRQEWAGRGVGIFNLIDQNSFYKIDFIVRRFHRYEIAKFNRRKQVSWGSHQYWIISIEDLIISKLQWVQDLQSERQLSDIAQLLDAPNLELTYIRNWVTELDLKTFGTL